MADATNAMREVLAKWAERRDASEAAFRDIRFGEEGYFQRAVSAVTPMLQQALAVRPNKGQVGRSLLEVFPMHLRAETSEITNESVEKLVERAATDFYSHQELEYLALNPTFLHHLPALRNWKQQVYLGVIIPPSRPRGQHKTANFNRDRAICRAISELEKVGFTPFRNKLSTPNCASDVVVESLGLCGHAVSYDAIERVWKDRDRLKTSAAGEELSIDVIERLLALLSDSNQTK